MTIKLPPDITAQNTAQNESSLKRYQNSAATFLFAVGMIVTAFAYSITPKLATSFQRPERKEPIDADVASGKG